MVIQFHWSNRRLHIYKYKNKSIIPWDQSSLCVQQFTFSHTKSIKRHQLWVPVSSRWVTAWASPPEGQCAHHHRRTLHKGESNVALFRTLNQNHVLYKSYIIHYTCVRHITISTVKGTSQTITHFISSLVCLRGHIVWTMEWGRRWKRNTLMWSNQVERNYGYQ